MAAIIGLVVLALTVIAGLFALLKEFFSYRAEREKQKTPQNPFAAPRIRVFGKNDRIVELATIGTIGVVSIDAFSKHQTAAEAVNHASSAAPFADHLAALDPAHAGAMADLANFTSDAAVAVESASTAGDLASIFASAVS